MKMNLSSACLCLAWMLMNTQLLQAQEEAVAEAVALPVEAIEQVTEAAGEAATGNAAQTATLRPLTVIASLTDDSQITGTLMDNPQIAVKTAFGEASIPLSEVAGVRFPSSEDTSTTIVMLNGDSITGATDVKFFNVETSWGNAKINGPAVASMLFVPGLTWQNTQSLGGKRWMLTDQKTAASPNNPAALGQPIQPSSTFGQSTSPNRQPNQFPSNGQPQVIIGR